MATSSQVRKWWAGYQRTPSKYVKVAFPGDGRVWNLPVADRSVPVWEAVAQIMASEPYLFLESAGGTYNPREPGSVSLHTFALALDLNPRKNPHQDPLKTDMPDSFVKRIEGIRANGKQAVTWGGRWTAPSKPDAMHYQINVAPADCVNVTWDHGGGDMANWMKPGDPVEDLDDARKVHAWQGNEIMTNKDLDYDENDPKLLDERYKMIVARIVNVMMK